ncbi:hypothetical protein IJ732_06840 [bacterium]|nr:hypothetical protein [bacterium]
MVKSMEIGLSSEELKKRTSKGYLNTKKMLNIDAPEYLNLAENDKKTLQKLVKAAFVLEEVFLKQDSSKNIAFRDFLKSEIKKGNKDAKLAMKLFIAQKGINAIDSESNKFSLMKGEKELKGKGFYPDDLTEKEFHKILINMLNDGQIDEVKNILNQHSIVIRSGKVLKAIDFKEYFEKEFTKAAKLLDEAAETSTNKDFAEYLSLQAKALRKSDYMADAYADKKWAELQDTPLEFTITRECYHDEMTGSVIENEELSKMLQKHNIVAYPKDYLGFRVGIVNKEGTEKLLEIKKYLPELAKEMPYNDKYEQNISATSDEVKQTMVDVDLVTVKGDVGSYRGGITLAENLPNDDKLSLTIGGGRRNVYHRQIRAISDTKKLQRVLNATLDKDLHKYYNHEADHWFTIGHENGHSLGPKSGTEALGKYRSIIEENKADMVSMAMLDKLEELGMYSHEQKMQIMTTFAADLVLKAKPALTQAHRVRTVMQMYYFCKNGALEIDKKGIIHINYDKLIPTAKKMLAEIVDIQISGNFDKGEKYVLDNFVWTDGMEKIAGKLRKISKTLNGTVKEPLANRLLRKL